MLPADLLVQFEPWRSGLDEVPRVPWDPLLWDGIAQYYPWRAFGAESLASGMIPLWNPYQFCGTPFVANGQSAIFYPFNLIFWLMPVARAFGWSAWLHLCLTGWFMYLLLRRIGVGRFGATAAAVVWQGNGFFVAWIHLPTVLCTASWLPMILLLLDKTVVRGRTGWRVAAGVALGLSYLGGHPQVFLLTALMAAAYLICRFWSGAVVLAPLRRLRRLAVAGAAVVATAAGLAALQLLPTLELLGMAHRSFVPGPESYDAFLRHSMPAAQLVGLLIPHAFGHPALGNYVGRDNHAEFAAYVGVVAIALALWGAVRFRCWHARFFALSALAAFLIALGTPLNWPLYHWVPGIARAGGPGRILVLAVFSMSALAGMGADSLARRAVKRSSSALAPIAVMLTLLGACYWAYLLLVKPAVAAVKPSTQPLAGWEGVRAWGAVALAMGAVVALGRPQRRRVARAALIVILAADLLLAARRHVHVSPADWTYRSLPFEAPRQARILSNARDWPIDRSPIAVLPPNSATVYGLRDAFGYDSLYLARFRDFAAALQHGDPSPPLNGNLLLARLSETYGLDMMSLAAVETVVSPVPVRGLTMERAGTYYVYSNPYAWPRAWVAESALHVPSHSDAVATLARLGPMPDCVLVTGLEELPGEIRGAERPRAEVTDLSPNRVSVELSQGDGGYLFLADAYAPGWRAHTEEDELPVRTAYLAFRTVAVPADAQSITFTYEPGSFRVGLFVTLVASMLIGCLAACQCVCRDEQA